MDDLTARKKRLTPDEQARAAVEDDLRARHPQGVHALAPVEHGAYAVRPSRAAWQRFRQTVKEGHEFVASANLVIDCVVHPTGDDLTALLDRFPALEETFTNQLAQLAGLEAGARAKKL